MEEKRKRGGSLKRGVNQTPTPLKLDNDLLEWLKDFAGESRNRFINLAVRERMERLKRMEKDAEQFSDEY